MGSLGRHTEQVTVARDQHRRTASDRFGQNMGVRRVADFDGRSRWTLHDLALAPEEGLRLPNHFVGHLHLVLQDAAELSQDPFPEHEFVLGQHDLQDLSGETSRGEGTQEDVGVEKNPHDTSRKTSSSVK